MYAYETLEWFASQAEITVPDYPFMAIQFFDLFAKVESIRLIACKQKGSNVSLFSLALQLIEKSLLKLQRAVNGDAVLGVDSVNAPRRCPVGKSSVS